MLLHTPDDALRLLTTALEAALAEPEVASHLRRHPVSVRLGLVDPDCVLLVDVSAGIVRLARPEDRADGIVAMDGDTAVRSCRGGLDLDDAVASGRIIADPVCRSVLEACVGAPAVVAAFASWARREMQMEEPALAG